MVSLRNDIVSFRFWGYRGDLRIELQAPVFIHKAWSLNSKIALQHRKIRSRLLPMYIRSNRKKFGGKRNNMRLSLFFLHCFGAQLHLLGCRCTTQFYHMTSRLWVITPCNKINKLLFLIGNSLREAVLSRKIHVQIMRVTSCLTWSLNWDLICMHAVSLESVAAVTDHFADAFVRENVARVYMTLWRRNEVRKLTLTPFCFEKKREI